MRGGSAILGSVKSQARLAAAADPGAQVQARRRGDAGRYDPWLLLAVCALVCIGIVMVASSSIAVADAEGLGPFHYLRRHLVYLGLGTVAAVVAARTELRLLERFSGVLIGLGMLSLLAVFVPGIGMRINGAQRWLDLGVASFQPVEAVKLAMICYLASYLVRHREAVERKLFGVFKAVLVVLVLAVLLLMQPDFGSAALLLAVAIGMIWLGGARMRNLLMLGLPLVPAAIWVAFSEDYRIQRLTSFLDPWKDPFNDGFQLTQALIAIGRGEWFGVGLGASVQKLFYLPEAHTDFILAVIGEEFGLFGILLVIATYVLLMARGLDIGLRGVKVGQQFAGYLAFGISLSIGLQAMVSIGVNLGVLPTKGLTLPLISSGGSSVLMTCAMAGVLLRVGYEVSRAEATRNMATRKQSSKSVREVPA